MPKKITLRGIIGMDDSATPEFLERELASANGDSVILEINSPGGMLVPGLEMSNMIRNYDGHVTAKIVGVAGSMASYIPMLADRVEVEDNTFMVIHNPHSPAFGDYRVMERMGGFLKDTAIVFAEAYAAKSGKSLAEISDIMDAETFLVGKSIVTEGFADEVIGGKGGGKEDKTTALERARLEITACAQLVDEAQIKIRPDYEKMAAMMNVATPPKKTTPKKTGEKEYSAMDLNEFLKKNPEARAEYDAEVKAATDAASEAGTIEGRKSGQEDQAEAMKVAIPILSSAQYPENVKEKIGEMAMKGDLDGVKAQVGTLEMMIENKKTEDAKDEETKETPANTSQGGEEVEATYQATKTRLQTDWV